MMFGERELAETPVPAWRLHGGNRDGKRIPWTLDNSSTPSIAFYDETNEQAHERMRRQCSAANFHDPLGLLDPGPRIIIYSAAWGDIFSNEMHAECAGFKALDDGEGATTPIAVKQRANINARYFA